MTDSDLRERFARLDEPEPLDTETVVRAAAGRKTRRDVLRIGGGVLAVGALGGLSAAAWSQLEGPKAVPAGPGTPSGQPTVHTSADASWTPPPSVDPSIDPSVGTNRDARNWPVQGFPEAGTLYHVTGNLGFMLVETAWQWWDLDSGTTVRAGEWQLGTPEQAPLNTCAGAGTEKIGGRNHYGVLLPVEAENVILGWASRLEIMLIAESHDLPASTGARLFYWSEDPDQVRRYRGFQLTFTMAGDENATTVKLPF